MTYQQAKSACFAYGTVPNGYFGDIAVVGFAWDPESQKTLIVANCGYYTAPIPISIHSAESLWLLQHHPAARNIRIKAIPMPAVNDQAMGFADYSAQDRVASANL